MMYWDTSCVLKLYTSETDSSWYIRLATHSSEPLGCSDLVKSELYYAFQRKEAAGDIRPHAAVLLYQRFGEDVRKGRFTFVPVGTDVIEKACEVARLCYAHSPPILLRTLDGLHLATALIARAGDLVVADERMKQAGRILRLNVVGPS